MANCVCHRNDGLTENGGTMILVHSGIDHHAVPILNLQKMETTAMCVNILGRPTKLVEVYLSPLSSMVVAWEICPFGW